MKNCLLLLFLCLCGCAVSRVERPAPVPPAADPAGATSIGRPTDMAEKDLGMMKTPWGLLHSFDRMRAVETVAPHYPLDERNAGITGEVALAVLVGEEGRVADVKVMVSSGYSGFDNEAVKAVRQWRYRPLEPRERFVSVQRISFAMESD